MYLKGDKSQLKFEDFYLPFGGKLRSDNRWVLLSKQIPWPQIEDDYATNFSDTQTGCPAKPARVALGALIIKERLGTTDRETVLQIAENAEQIKQEKRQFYRDEVDRIPVEGKFGQSKRRFSLDRVMAKLATTSETVIMVAFIVMNLEKVLAACLYFCLRLWHMPPKAHQQYRNFA